MLEIPEATVIAKQIRETLTGRSIVSATVNESPHQFAWFYQEASEYPKRLAGQAILGARAAGGFVEVTLTTAGLVFGDGVNLKWTPEGGKIPSKHQLKLTLDDHSTLTATVQMYGGIWCYPAETGFDNPYYQTALMKPQVLSPAFTEDYFLSLTADEAVSKLSLKAFLATEQRIPGLGNGILQDILFEAKLHPKRKVRTLDLQAMKTLYAAVVSVVSAMTEQGGRDTEKTLGGEPGGYLTKLSRLTLDKPCQRCGGPLAKEAYLGGSIYYCSICQRLQTDK